MSRLLPSSETDCPFESPSTATPPISRTSLVSPPASRRGRLQCFMQPAALTRPRPRIVLPAALFAPAPFPVAFAVPRPLHWCAD